MRLILLSIFITLFWLIMMAKLITQHILPDYRRAQTSLIEPEILAGQWLDVNESMWIRHGNEDLGGMLLTVEQLGDDAHKGKQLPGYRVEHNLVMTVPFFQIRQPVQFNMTMDLSAEFNVSKFVAVVHAPPFRVQYGGFVLEDRLFYRVVQGNGYVSYHSVQLKRPLSLMDAVRPMIARQFDLEVGHTDTVDVLDPIFSLARGKATITVADEEKIVIDGEEVDAFRMESTFRGITHKSWVNRDGITLRRELFGGIYMEQGNKREIAKAYPRLKDLLEIPEYDFRDFIQLATEETEEETGPANLLGLVESLFAKP